MRLSRILPLIAALAVPGAAFAANWFEYRNQEDFFTLNLPEQPKVESFTYVSEYGSKLPARRYTATDGVTRYTMTVVNMTTTDREPNRHGSELRGSIQFASTALRRTGTVTMDIYNEIEVVPGQMLQITLPNKLRNYAGVYFLNKHLYIMEAVAPQDAAPPILYQASLGFLDAAGNSLRYEDNNYSFPDGRPLARQGGAGAPAGGGAGRGAGGG